VTHDEFKTRYIETIPTARTTSHRFNANCPCRSCKLVVKHTLPTPRTRSTGNGGTDFTYDTIEDARAARDAKADRLLPGPDLYRDKQRKSRRAPGTELTLVPDPDVDKIAAVAQGHPTCCFCLICRAAAGSTDALRQARLVLKQPDARHYETRVTA
jgi:hypothetical protein